MKTFKIYNNVRIKFGFMDSLRILFGKEVKISITTHAEKEVEVFGKMTEHSIYVERFIKKNQSKCQHLNSISAHGCIQQ